MYPDYINTSILTINGTEVCRISHDNPEFREEVIKNAVAKLAPSSIDTVPQKFWGFMRGLASRGQKVDAIKLVRILNPNLHLVEAKELMEFIVSLDIDI
jgi:hypothetical protein